MNFLVGWANTIIVFILLATIIGMLLPNSSLQKYVKMVISLLLIVIIINPIFLLFKTDLNKVLASFNPNSYLATGNTENLIDLKKTEIQANARAYILEQMAVQMKKQVEEQMGKDYNMEVVTLQLHADEKKQEIKSQEDIQRVDVVLKPISKKESGEVQSIKKVEIKVDRQEVVTPDESVDLKKIQVFLAGKWQLSKAQVVVSKESGGQ